MTNGVKSNGGARPGAGRKRRLTAGSAISRALRDAIEALDDRPLERRLRDALGHYDAADYARAADDLAKCSALLRALCANEVKSKAENAVLEMM